MVEQSTAQTPTHLIEDLQQETSTETRTWLSYWTRYDRSNGYLTDLVPQSGMTFVINPTTSVRRRRAVGRTGHLRSHQPRRVPLLRGPG